MANKLIEDLAARANVLVTDLLEVQPVAGAPSEKGTVTQIFTDSTGTLAINRDGRILIDGGAGNSVNWHSRLLIDASNVNSANWETRKLLDSTAQISVDWLNRQLVGSDGSTVVLDWSVNTPIETVQRVFSTPTSPEGVVTATKPAICYGDDGSLWVKGTAGPNNTGWVVLISA